jgi:PRC-barrel domain protein
MMRMRPLPHGARSAMLAALVTLALPELGRAGQAAPAAAKPAPEPPAAAPPPRNLEPLPPGKYTGILGKKVAGLGGEDLGPIVDVIVNVDGTPRAAVIDFGGFLGVGSRKIAVDWRLLNFAPDRANGRVWLSLDRAEIQAAPEYRPDAASDMMVGPPWEAPLSPAAGK